MSSSNWPEKFIVKLFNLLHIAAIKKDESTLNSGQHFKKIQVVQKLLLLYGYLGYYYFFSKWLLFKRQMRNFSAISWREQVTFQWNDNDVHVLLNQIVGYL